MYRIIDPANSFVFFGGDNQVQHCIWGTINTCMPVYADDDIAFQFVVAADTPEEIAALCNPTEPGIEIGLVLDCDQESFTVQFTELPDRYKISDTQVLFNWPHGLPGMTANVSMEACFAIRVVISEDTFCSNCFQRIPDDCFTSVVEYGNDDNFAGFNYCNSGGVSPDAESCEPTIINFTNQSTLSIPYTTSMQNKYGTVPTVQVWIYDGDGVPTNMGVSATFDAMPPNFINVDLGGPASGFLVIR